MRRARIRASIFVLVYLLFVLLMDYPYLSRLYNDSIAGDVIASYERGEQELDCESRLNWAASYNRYLAGEGPCPAKGPWQGEKLNTEKQSESLGLPESGDHNAITSLSGDDLPVNPSENPEMNSQVQSALVRAWENAARVLCQNDSAEAGWIRIKSLNLMLPLYVGTGEKALRSGTGILELCSLPVGGESTHACISAHRGLPDRTLFTNLDLLKRGDRILVHTLNRTLAYEVTGAQTVLPVETDPLKIRSGEDLLTLITCTPYGINTHRLYVHAKRCDMDEDPDAQLPVMRDFLDPLFWKLWWWIPATIVLTVFLIILVRRYLRRYRI